MVVYFLSQMHCSRHTKNSIMGHVMTRILNRKLQVFIDRDFLESFLLHLP